MFKYSLSWYLFTFTLFESIIKTHLTVHDSSHGFISSNQRYFDDDLNLIHEEITSGLRSARFNDATLNLQLKFEPATLDFKYRPIGVPHLEKVTLFNIDNNKTIDMTSISGSTLNFYSSFFEDKKIPPLGNTSFSVVFLGREEGYVESSLFIHTNEGHFKYNVKGASIYSPYRLRPIINIKLPVNTTFTPLIYMHNPHNEPIQILEMHSSGGDFHLELPSGDIEGPKDIWEIPPLSTRAVIRLRLQAKYEQNHTAYIRIKINRTDDVLVVPVDIEVSPNGGLYHPQGFIDFGVGGSLDTPKKFNLCLYNPLKKSIRIHSVTTTSESIRVHYQNVKLSSIGKITGREECVNIGTLIFDWKTAFKNKDFAGKVTINYRNGKSKTEIPYYATILEGGLTYDPFITRYFIHDQSHNIQSRSFKVKNNFLTSIRLINFTLPEDAQRYFKIENFKPSILRPQQETHIFTIKFKPGIRLSDLRINSNITIKTNISEVVVPLLSYNGKLHVFLPFKGKDYSLDLGLFSFDSKKEINFLILNKNPVSITVKNVKTSVVLTTVTLLGCGRGDTALALLQDNFKNLTRCSVIRSDEYGIIQLNIQTFNAETQIWGDVQIETQYENLSVPVHFKVAYGKLEIGPDRLVFDQCFPGKICSHPIRVHSTFNEPMVIEKIISLPPDIRLNCKHHSHILARANKVIGHLYLDPTLECGNECYTGLQHDTTAQWLKTLSILESVAEFDLNLVNVFYNRYLNVTSNGLKKWQNLTLRLDTSEVRNHLFRSRVKMSWPSLLLEPNHIENKSVFTFPLTQIGNITYRNITIRNPSSYNLIIQLIFDRDYPDIDTIFEAIPSNFIPDGFNNLKRIKYKGFFFKNDYRNYHNQFIDLINLNVNINTIPVLLEPNQNFTFTIGFQCDEIGTHSSLLFLRNNLTILEIIKLNGQCLQPSFKFGNRKPGSTQPLLFELTEKHLKDCEIDKQIRNNRTPNLTVKRSFTARNIGDVTIYVNRFFINDMQCEGYGFKVINCNPFILHPNSTRKIDIAFTSDLTLSKIQRLLILDTSLNIPVNYSLHTTIPPYYLNVCSNLIIRPHWEIYLSYITISFMLLLVVFIILLAIMDAERIKKHTINTLMSPNNLTTQPVLDLRLVGQQTRAEIRSSNKIETNNDDVSNKKIDDCCNNNNNNNNNNNDDDNNSNSSNNKNDEKIEEIDENKLKPEPEKYTVLVPTVGKCKKKLARKNEIDNIEMLMKEEAQKKPNEVQNINNKRKSNIEIRINERKKDVKENNNNNTSVIINNNNNNNTNNSNFNKRQQNKKFAKNTYVPVYEEETSSTTTESSSNNEDDKEVDQRNSKICSKKPIKIDNTIENRHNIQSIEVKPVPQKRTQQINHQHSHQIKIDNRKRLNLKLHQSNKLKEKEHDYTNINNNNNANNKNEIKSHEYKKSNNRCKKEKYMNNKKQSQGSHKTIEKQRDSPLIVIRSSPPTTPPTLISTITTTTTSPATITTSMNTVTTNVWNENRATFSDVVARNENQTNTVNIMNTRPISQIQTNKPTVYVEPYLQIPNELGPIGSRPIDYWQDNDAIINQQQQQQQTNSYFTNNPDENLTFLDDFVQNSNNDNNSWNQTDNFANLLDDSEPYTPLDDPWDGNLDCPNATFWNSIYNNPPVQQTAVGQQSGYLWGSSSVWQPWAPPDVPRTPTRTPPGFDTFPQQHIREEPNIQTRETYNPFGTTILWTQEQPQRPWNYQGQ